MPIKSHLSNFTYITGSISIINPNNNNTKNHKTDYNNKKYKSISSVKLTHVKVILEVWCGNEKKKKIVPFFPLLTHSLSHILIFLPYLLTN